MPKKIDLPAQNDPPVEIHGYKTDPLRRGYQVLWNYESSYWRTLVGNEAWSLYEVLRSFCHDGNNICRPSVNLLMAILGLKERRVLTGWTKKIKGKEYIYQGLIEILQQYDLATVEVQGYGPEMRYIFHVNLTPGLLRDEQLAQLPELLQRKHIELLARCEKDKQELKEKRRPPKAPHRLGSQKSGGSGNLPEGYEKLPEGSGNLPVEQYPYNTTQITTTVAEEKIDHYRDEPDPKQDVVASLIDLGMAERVAQRLTHRYNREHILEKIDMLEYLQKSRTGKVKNPLGWLRRAIEENYAPPAGYETKDQRQAKATERKKRQQEIEQALAAQEIQREKLGSWREWLVEQYSISSSLQEITDQMLKVLKPEIGVSSFHTWVANMMITELGEKQVRIAVPSQNSYEWVIDRLKSKFEEILTRLLGRPIKLEFEVIKRLPPTPSTG